MYQDFVHAIRDSLRDLGLTMEKLGGFFSISFKNGSKITVFRYDCRNRSALYNTVLYAPDMTADHVLELGSQVRSYEEVRAFVRAAGFDCAEEDSTELDSYLDSFKIISGTNNT